MQAQYPWTKEIVGSETTEVRAVNGRSVLGGMQVPNQIAEVRSVLGSAFGRGFHTQKARNGKFPTRPALRLRWIFGTNGVLSEHT